MRNGTPDDLIVCLARLIRCAIVASGTRNALAISAVVRPPTARSVSAIADGRRQRRMTAHEEQDQRVVLLARPSPRQAPKPRLRLVAWGGAAAHPLRSTTRFRGGAGPTRRAGDRSCAARRPGSASRAGCRACPPRAIACAAASSASCTASSAAAKSPKRRIDRAEHLRRKLAQQVLASESGAARVTLRRAVRSSPRAPRSACSAARRPCPARPTRGPRSRRRARSLSHVHDPVAREELLGFGERAVGDLGRAVLSCADDARLSGRASPSAPTSSPDALQLLGEVLHERRCAPSGPPAPTSTTLQSPLPCGAFIISM